jgi:hypothetical protein
MTSVSVQAGTTEKSDPISRFIYNEGISPSDCLETDIGLEE